MWRERLAQRHGHLGGEGVGPGCTGLTAVRKVGEAGPWEGAVRVLGASTHEGPGTHRYEVVSVVR